MVNTDVKLNGQDRPEAGDLRQRCDASGSGPPMDLTVVLLLHEVLKLVPLFFMILSLQLVCPQLLPVLH